MISSNYFFEAYPYFSFPSTFNSYSFVWGCVGVSLQTHPNPFGNELLRGKETACSIGDQGSIPGLVRSPGERKGNPLQYSLENSMNRGAYSLWGHKELGMTEWLTFHFKEAKRKSVFLWLTPWGHFEIPKAGQSPEHPQSTTHSQVEYESHNMFFSWSTWNLSTAHQSESAEVSLMGSCEILVRGLNRSCKEVGRGGRQLCSPERLNILGFKVKGCLCWQIS